MKLGFYINTLQKGGAERVICNLANACHKHGYEVVFITSFPVADEYILDKDIVRFNLEEEELENGFVKENLQRTMKVRKICKKYKLNMLVSFMAAPNFRNILATRFLKTKSIISIRNLPEKEYFNRVYRLMAKVLFPFADGIVFQTEDAKGYFSKRVQKKSKIIWNMVDEKFYQNRVQYDYEQRKQIVSIGRLVEQKRHDIFIKAFSKIADKYPNISVKIYGEGKLQDELRGIISECGMTERITLCGNIEDVVSALDSAKIFVMSSDYEGMPNTIMEAMTRGVPVIATDCPCGGPQLLLGTGSGVLIEKENIMQLAEAMDDLLKSKRKAEELASLALQASEHFRNDIIAREWMEFIERI